MKFKFTIQPYQTQAVESVVNVFKGQPYVDNLTYSIDLGTYQEEQEKLKALKDFGSMGQQTLFDTSSEADLFEPMTDTGYANKEVTLSGEMLLENIQDVQNGNNMHTDTNLVLEKGFGYCNLDVEMETGTGKTYVYLKTILELNKNYGWSKFIIVVPSIAIREGVKKSLEITAEHFFYQYGKNINFFVYNSKELNKIDDYSSSPDIQVMVINTQAFNTIKEGAKNEAARIIFSERDDFHSRRPIDVISANRPIIIRDEPQKQEGKGTKEGLKQFKPLFVLNYSATHAEKHNLVYVMDSIEAYNEKLVKQIEVRGLSVSGHGGTGEYIYLSDIKLSPNKPPVAKLEIEVNQKSKIVKKLINVSINDDLYELSHELDEYKGYVVEDIRPLESVIVFTNGVKLHINEAQGDVEELDRRRVQIRETLIAHLKKEKRNFRKGIKTLSLFFLDKVANYRQYDDNGDELLGEYGRIFEEEYENIFGSERDLFDDKYQAYIDGIDVKATHKGYFSIDKKGHSIDSKVKRGEEYADDESAYDLIMKDKERLLSFEEPVRFIFSHSALREGWDNPNVFQICMLKHDSNAITNKRQEVGRGLRLCVNSEGTRLDAGVLGDKVHDINRLTVIADESFEKFAKDLQDDIRREGVYDRPKAADYNYFAGKVVYTVDKNQHKLTINEAKAIYKYLAKNEYIDDDDHVTKKCVRDIKEGIPAPLPEILRPYSESIFLNIKAIKDNSAEKQLNSMIKNASKAVHEGNPLNENFQDKDFQNLWKEINHFYAYSVSLDSDELIKCAVRELDRQLHIEQVTYTVKHAVQKDKLSAEMIDKKKAFEDVNSSTNKLMHVYKSSVRYDIIGKLSAGTHLTRKTVAKILQEIAPGTFAMFKWNPEEFIKQSVDIINQAKNDLMVPYDSEEVNIEYRVIDGEYDANTIFVKEHSEIEYGRAFPSKKHIQPYVFTDGSSEESVELKFAKALEGAEEVKVFAKLPRDFHIPTPAGNYAPDWAVVFMKEKVKHIYFVAETKGSTDKNDLRGIENVKIRCAKKLFDTIEMGQSENKVKYTQVDAYNKLLKVAVVVV